MASQSDVFSGNQAQWDSESIMDAQILFPGSVSSFNYPMTQHPFGAAYNTNDPFAGSIQDSGSTAAQTRADSISQWMTDMSAFNMLDCASTAEPQTTIDQPNLPPAAPSYDLLMTGMAFLGPQAEPIPLENSQHRTFQHEHTFDATRFQYSPEALRLPPDSVLSDPVTDAEGLSDFDEADAQDDIPYARLIWEALRSAPNYALPLVKIYEYIEHNTDKLKTRPGEGWKNSVRHNLSMNKAFQRTVLNAGGKGRGNMGWGLVAPYIEQEPLSTTLYRPKPKAGRSRRRNNPPRPQRQRAGARGGIAARGSAQRRRSERLQHRQPVHASTPEAALTGFGSLPLLSSPAGSLGQHSSFLNPPEPPLFELESMRHRRLYQGHASRSTFNTNPFGFQQAAGGVHNAHNTHARQSQTSDFGPYGQIQAPSTMSPHQYLNQLNQITFDDLRGADLFASVDSSFSGSEPMTPSTSTNSLRGAYGGDLSPNGRGIDPNAFVCFS